MIQGVFTQPAEEFAEEARVMLLYLIIEIELKIERVAVPYLVSIFATIV